MHSSRAVFSSLQTQHGLTLAEASPCGLRSAAALLGCIAELIAVAALADIFATGDYDGQGHTSK